MLSPLKMVYSRLLFFFSLIFLHLIALTIAQPNELYLDCLKEMGSFTANSVYQENRNLFLSSISSSPEIEDGYYSSSYGQDSDTVFAIALCRGDVTTDSCRSCVNNSSNKLTQLCPTSIEAIIWYDNCMLRYTNRSVLRIMEPAPYFWKYNLFNVTDVDQFNQARNTLLDRLRTQAASGDSLLKCATGVEPAPNSQTIHALVQCTPNLTEEECSECLNNATALIPQCCEKAIGAAVYNPSCNFRYENESFYGSLRSPNTSTPNGPLPPPTTATPNGSTSRNRNVIIIIVSVVVFVLFIICISIYLRVRKARGEVETVNEISSPESLQFKFDTIRQSTDNFSDANKLGQGGFGVVYKGKLSNGQDIAVKRLSIDSRQGEVEFKNEVLFVAKLQHRNLVRLLGFCIERAERLLIYEFVPNSSLNNFIFDPIKRAHLDWETRHRIIGGIARGLLYLHEDSRLRIIHRDLKAGNILLDAGMNPKISDFGMAKLFTLDQTQDDTDKIAGTFGYMAPEYVRNGHFSVKSDVFSFGVLVLEIVSGQKISSFRNGEEEEHEHMLSYAWENWKEGNTSNLIDPTLNVGSRSEMTKCINIGLLCVQENVDDRPTMSSVVAMFNSYFATLPEPSKPGFFIHNTVTAEMPLIMADHSESTESDQLRRESIPLSINEVSITELYPR